MKVEQAADHDARRPSSPGELPTGTSRASTVRLLLLFGLGWRWLLRLPRGGFGFEMGAAEFARALGGSLRPHFFALPVGAALAGAGSGPVEQPWRVAVAAAATGLGWGAGQLLNDLLDREADQIDAPHRPAARGRLPEGPTMAVAMLLGLSIALCTAWLHPSAAWLALLAMLLMLGYGPAKARPLLGNLAHGALIAVAAWIGAVAAAPRLELGAVVTRAGPVAAVVGAWAMIYLESNYEKDRRGDHVAGYRTLPLVLGLRPSAALRAAGALLVGSWAHVLGLLPGKLSVLSMTLAVALVWVSSLRVLLSGTDQSALSGYRPSVHAAGLGMLGLGWRALGDLPMLCLVLANAALVELAFRRSPNP